VKLRGALEWFPETLSGQRHLDEEERHADDGEVA
jgi:hypothetical protein